MSMTAWGWARTQQVGGGTTKLVLMFLADHADEVGYCWPHTETLAEYAEIDERTVRRHIGKLEKAGVLTRTRRRRSDGTLAGYEYQLHIPPEFVVRTPHYREESPPDRTAGAVDGDTSGTNPPAGRLSGGDRHGRKARADARRSGGQHSPAGRPPGIANGASGDPTSGTNSPAGRLSGGEPSDHRTTDPAPPDNGSRTTGQPARSIKEEPTREPTRRPSSSPSPPGRRVRETELEAFLGDLHRPALDLLRALPAWSPMVERSFVGRYVTGMMGEQLLKGVPPELHPSVVAECVYQFLEEREEGDPPPRWNGARFTGWLRQAGMQARKTVSYATVAAVVSDAAEDGTRELAGGGLVLPDGRRLTRSQAEAYRRTLAKLAGARGGER